MIKQLLEHGKFLCKNNFNSFVECWNQVVNRIQNIKGDEDADQQSGYIKVDNTNEEHPIIRFDFGKLKNNLSSASSQDTLSHGCFALSCGTNGYSNSKIFNCYYNEGGLTKHMNDVTISLPEITSGEPQFVCLRIDGSDLPHVNIMTSFTELQTLQRDAFQYVNPLYMIGLSSLITDMRNSPNLQIVEQI